MKKYPLVLVTWEDAWVNQGTDWSAEDLRAHEPCIQVYSGNMIENSSKYVRLATEYDAARNTFSGVKTIPKPLVRRIERSKIYIVEG